MNVLYVQLGSSGAAECPLRGVSVERAMV